jgi:hypothetical protein
VSRSALSPNDLRRKAEELSRRWRGETLTGGRFPGEQTIGEFPIGRLQMLVISVYQRSPRSVRTVAFRVWQLGIGGQRWPVRQAGLSFPADCLPHLAELVAAVMDSELQRTDDDPLPDWAESRER